MVKIASWHEVANLPPAAHAHANAHVHAHAHAQAHAQSQSLPSGG